MKKLFTLILIIGLNLLLYSCQQKPIYQITINKQDGSDIVIIETTGKVNIDIPERTGYKFLGWLTEDGKLFDLENITTDLELKASWLKIGEKCSIFYDPKNGVMPTEYPNKYYTGSSLELPIPTKEHYEFIGWYLDSDSQDGPYFELPDNISGTKTLYAAWKDIADYRDINYHLNGGTFDREVINKYIPGEVYQLVSPIKEGFFFRGWYTSEDYRGEIIKRIDSTWDNNLELYAKWVESSISNTYISIYGDSISTFSDYLPDGYATYYPIAGINVNSVEDTWWYKAINKIGANYHSNSSYSNTGVVSTGSSEAFKGCDEERIATLEKNNLPPDIIIIFLGVNDCKRGIKADAFRTGYIQMLERMRKAYPGVDFVLCTLNSCTFSGNYEPLRKEYNQVIQEIATSQNLRIARLDQVITENNKAELMANMLHPNKEGMEKIAEEVAAVLIK